MKMLMAKLLDLKEQEQKKIEDLKGDYSQIAWGTNPLLRIPSYSLVKITEPMWKWEMCRP